MKTESKTDLLLQMTEQPEQYTEEQWRDILSDDECRELYTLMALTQGAMRAAQADAALTEDEITEDWEKVKREKYRLPEPSEGKSYFSLFTLSSFTFKKTAAIFIAAVFLGGLSFAAYRVFSPPKEQQPREVM